MVRAPDHILSFVRMHYLPLLELAARRVLELPAAVEVVGDDWVATPDGGAGVRPPANTDAGPLNPKYTFEQFVIADSNRFAHAAALAVAEMPGQTYSPLFLHGPPGVGKTHLLQAIGSYVRRYELGLDVRYATVEEFTNRFVQAVRGHDTKGFKERFRTPDVLLIDDVQFLETRVRTKEELFHTLNALHERGSQLVISSDRAPRHLTGVETRLRERFQCGLVVELAPPCLEARIAILRKRARHDGLEDVTEDTLAEIAGRVKESVRALEGALIRVVAYASLVEKPITARLVKAALEQPSGGHSSRRTTVGHLQVATARAFGVTQKDLLAHDRRAESTLARQVAMYLAREVTEEALPALGRAFGNRNHTTVLHAHRKIADKLKEDASLQTTIEGLKEELDTP